MCETPGTTAIERQASEYVALGDGYGRGLLQEREDLGDGVVDGTKFGLPRAVIEFVRCGGFRVLEAVDIFVAARRVTARDDRLRVVEKGD
jgi:hypothetical protein